MTDTWTEPTSSGDPWNEPSEDHWDDLADALAPTETELEWLARQRSDAETGGAEDAPSGPIEFLPLREFLRVDYPQAESLAGHTRQGTNLLPRFGWVMPWGSYGCSKTTLVVDLVFHGASGREWIGYPLARPIRWVVIVNEGIPGALQDKLAAKLELWDDPDAAEQIAVYKSPWGEFTFRDERMREHLRDFARDFEADYVVGDPLHSLGTSGTGTPEETEEFKHLLRRFGVWEWVGILTPHHTNKAGSVSGDWGRHPDTVIRVEKDGRQPRTKLTLEKARLASPDELGVPVILEWVTDSLGFRRIETEAMSKVTDGELLERIHEAVEASPGLSMTDLRAAVSGDDSRIGKLARAEVEAGRIGNQATRKGTYCLYPAEELVGEPPPPDTDDPELW